MPSFLVCVTDNLKARGFKKAEVARLTQRFEGIRSRLIAQGDTAPDANASLQLFKELDYLTSERKRLRGVTFQKLAEWKGRFESFNRNTRVFLPGNNKDADWSAPVRAGIEGDPRSGALSFEAHKDTTRGQLYRLIGDPLIDISKGLLGRQRGKSTLDNLADEIFGVRTGDKAAADLAVGVRAMFEAVPRLFRLAGGAMNTLKGPFMPDPNNMRGLLRVGRKAWVEKTRDRLDWNRTLWPDGSLIDPADRTDFLERVWRTKKSDGVSKLKPSEFNGRGAAVGNLLEQHRLLHYKDAASWKASFKEFNDGTMFDMLIHYVEDSSHKIGLIKVFGPNPAHMFDTVRAMAMKRAELQDGAAPARKRTMQSRTEAGFKTKVGPMFEVATRKNPMDPDSHGAQSVVGLSNLLLSAQLGSAALLAIPGDPMTTAISRLWSGQSAFGGMGHYFAALGRGNEAKRIAFQSGLVMDEVVNSIYAAQRWTGVETFGPHITKRTADVVLRSSFLSPHTKAARYASRMETMGLLHRTKGLSFEVHPLREVFGRYGITAEAWDAFRAAVPVWELKPGVKFARPADLLDGDLANKQDLYDRFQGMILEESRNMVLMAKTEGAVMLKGTSRPDTIPGAILHSFTMYKSFPMSLWLTYSRLAMANPKRGSRIAMLAGLAAGMTMVGAVGTQMREISKGRDPMAMNTPKFWGRAVLSGGALSVMGDVLFAGVNQFGRGPDDIVAGPVVMFAGDALQLALGDTFNWVDQLGTLDEQRAGTPWLAKANEFGRRYTPGTSIWWARTALERQFFDRMQELADPRAYQKWARRRQRRVREYNQSSFFGPGERAPSRLPSFEGVLGQ